MIEGAALVVALLVAFGAGFGLRRRFPKWGRVRVSLLGGLPVPALLWALCLILFIRALTASKEACGVDACAMMAMAAMFVAGYTLAVYVVCVALAAIGCGLATPKLPQEAEEFE